MSSIQEESLDVDLFQRDYKVCRINDDIDLDNFDFLNEYSILNLSLKSILSSPTSNIDCIYFEEKSLLPILLDDRDQIIKYLKPLTDTIGIANPDAVIVRIMNPRYLAVFGSGLDESDNRMNFIYITIIDHSILDNVMQWYDDLTAEENTMFYVH